LPDRPVPEPGDPGRTPQVTVVIPTCDRAWALPTAVRSAAAQTFRALEIIVVDDGSRDDTPEICRHLAARDPRVRHLRQANRGLPAARNAGLAAARGEWVAFLDDDDLWHPRFVEAMLAHARATARPTVACLAATFTAQTEADAVTVLAQPDRFRVEAWPTPPPPELIEATDLILRPLAPPHSGLFQRDLLLRLGGYDEGLRSAEDYDLWLRAAAMAAIPVLPETLALIRLHPQQMSHRLATMSSSTRIVLERFAAAHPEVGAAAGTRALRRRLAALAEEEAYASLLASRRLATAAAALQALRYRPARLKSLAYLVLAPTPGLYRALRRVVRRLGDSDA